MSAAAAIDLLRRVRRVLRFMCSCDCMSCVHGQHCGQCRSDNRLRFNFGSPGGAR